MFRPGDGQHRFSRPEGELCLNAGGGAVALHLVEGGAELLTAQGARRLGVEPVGRPRLGRRRLEPRPGGGHGRLGGDPPTGRLPRPAARRGRRLLEHRQ